MKTELSGLIPLEQWFPTFSLKGGKSRFTTLYRAALKIFHSKLTHFVLLQNKVCYTKY